MASSQAKYSRKMGGREAIREIPASPFYRLKMEASVELSILVSVEKELKTNNASKLKRRGPGITGYNLSKYTLF